MDKARRHELKMLKYKKRLTNYRLKEGDGNFFAFRSHGKPCSCFVCQQPEDNYKRTACKKEGFLVIAEDTIEGIGDESIDYQVEDILSAIGL